MVPRTQGRGGVPIHHARGCRVRRITKIIIHCSATPPDMDIGASEIRTWHVRDNGWADIGYHWVIRRDGLIEAGRPEALKGAHCAARQGNVASIGVCLVGGVRRGKDAKGKAALLTEDNFTEAQWLSLEIKVQQLRRQYPEIDTILGHRDLDPGKDCPSFSVREWLRRSGLAVSPLWPEFNNVIHRAIPGAHARRIA
jgi:N-acetylmuramoyl-L-alanine amidase